MPRTARIVLPGYPHHIVHRGHNKQAVFIDESDFVAYHDDLLRLKSAFGAELYAFCLMTNHVHLLLSPESDGDLGGLMKRLASRHTRRVNRIRQRTGTLWESRFKSSPVATDEYLLSCTRYIELNPVRAGLVSDPASYPWSSYAAKIGRRDLHGIDLDPCYIGLAHDAALRCSRYRDWVMSAVSDAEIQLLRASVSRGQLTGTAAFVDEVERKVGKRIDPRGPGRPLGAFRRLTKTSD